MLAVTMVTTIINYNMGLLATCVNKRKFCDKIVPIADT